MPKNLFIDPKVVRQPQFIEFDRIPVNQYNKTFEEEKKNFTTEEFVTIYHDMVVIREFETMLNLIKTTNEYRGIRYNHPGPAHLSIGQEASAVGMAYTLDRDDFIFGSHRSHGEILYKGLSAINKLDEETLWSIMSSYFGGNTLKVAEKDSAAASGSWQFAFCFTAHWPRYFPVQTDSIKDWEIHACLFHTLWNLSQ